MRALANLKKTIKRRNKEHPETALHIISVPCMDLCPKNGVTVCLPGKEPGILLVIRKAGQIDELYRT